MTAKRFRKKPVEIEAMQWDGDPWGDRCGELVDWTDDMIESVTGRKMVRTLFMALDSDDARDMFEEADTLDRIQAGYTAVVWDDLHGTWVNVATGDWIIKGLQGEFYPCRPDVFADTYEAVP